MLQQLRGRAGFNTRFKVRARTPAGANTSTLLPGRVFAATPGQLGEYVLHDYVANKRKLVS